MRVLAFVVACTLIAQPADLDRKLWIQNLLVRMEKARDEGATRVRAAEALVLRQEDLLGRTIAGSVEARTTAQKALEASRAALGKRRMVFARSEAAVVRIQQVLKHLEIHGGRVQALPLAIKGEAWIETGGARRALGQANPWLEPGDTLVTGPGSRVELEAFGGQAALVIGPDSRITLPLEAEPRIDLGLGKVLGRWKARLNSKLSVHTPTCIIAVRGTQFVVEAGPAGGATCMVMEGLVEVSDPSGKVTRQVGAGQCLRVEASPIAGQPLREVEAVDPRTLDRWWEREEGQ